MWTRLDYNRRMRVTIGFSIILHAVTIYSYAMLRPETRGPNLATQVDPISMTIAPDSRPRRLIDATDPAEEAPDPDTDLISEENSNARDMSEEEGTRTAPHVEDPAKYDALGGPEEPAPVIPPAPEPVNTPPQAPDPEPKPITEVMEEAMLKSVTDAPLPDPTPEVPREQEADKVQLAQRDPPAPVFMKPGEVKGRDDGGANRRGLLSYEAMANQFAPYLKEVRGSVERRWKALMINYTGARTTEAVIDCSIGPDGHLVKVEIVAAGDSATYAALCKKAIEDAGPFKPFPFRIPEIYAEETLDIRWTFSFL